LSRVPKITHSRDFEDARHPAWGGIDGIRASFTAKFLCSTNIKPVMFFVYIIQSLKDYSYYFGISSNLEDRLIRHNRNYERYTRNRSPWRLVWCTSKKTRSDALSLERKLKNMKSKKRIREFIQKYPYSVVAIPEDHASA
jgi:putative endonuclease